MKKRNTLVLAAVTCAAFMLFSTRCKKNETVTPVLIDTVITTTVVLNTQLAMPQSSFYSVDSGLVFQMLAAAKSDCKMVDFVHCFRANEGNRIICAPSDSNATIIWADTSIAANMSTWAYRNTTKFRGPLTITWNAVDSTAILNQTSSLKTYKTSAFNLMIGDVYAFVTTNGTRGLFKVTDTTSANNVGVSIGIQVKKVIKVY